MANARSARVTPHIGVVEIVTGNYVPIARRTIKDVCVYACKNIRTRPDHASIATDTGLIGSVQNATYTCVLDVHGLGQDVCVRIEDGVI